MRELIGELMISSKAGDYLAGCADGYFDHSFINGRYSQVFAVQTGLQKRDDDGYHSDGCSYTASYLDQLLALFFSLYLFRYLSVHI